MGMMEEKGKMVEGLEGFLETGGSESEISCRKHPKPSSVGVCADCLRDRLVKLVCLECGGQRLSFCSCSHVSVSVRNSCSALEVGSVGRISFLIQNEKTVSQSQRHHDFEVKKNVEETGVLPRSSSSALEVKKNGGFWGISRLFRKKRSHEFSGDSRWIWLSDIVSRSASFRSFRGGNDNHHHLVEDSGYFFSTANKSDAANGSLLDLSKDSEPRKSGLIASSNPQNDHDFQMENAICIQNSSVFPVKESEFRALDESSFIDFKLDSPPESKQAFTAAGASDHGVVSKTDCFQADTNLASLKSSSISNNSESCRITLSERGFKKGSKHQRAWKWIFKNHPTTKKYEGNKYNMTRS